MSVQSECTLLNMSQPKEISFSLARQRFSAIIDDVERTGKPIKILRHGKVAAVVVGPEEYQRKTRKKPGWKLAGSMFAIKSTDLQNALERLSDRNIKGRQRSLDKSVKEFLKD